LSLGLAGSLAAAGEGDSLKVNDEDARALKEIAAFLDGPLGKQEVGQLQAKLKAKSFVTIQVPEGGTAGAPKKDPVFYRFFVDKIR